LAGHVDGDLGGFREQGEEEVRGWAAEKQSSSNLHMNIILVEIFEPGFVVSVEYRISTFYTSL
jgi:hypothetical protein